MIDVRARENSSARNGLRFLMRAVASLMMLLFVASCGNDIFLVGTPVITLTAQRGHFLSYVVTIDEIEMTRKDGTVIELPMVSQRVDLANLGNFTQLLGAPAIGTGTYVSATFFVDYESPLVYVDNGGSAIGAVLTDASTNTTPTVDTITVKFDPNNPLVISNQVSSTVNFNFDLEASNSIDYAGETTSVPVLVHPIATVTANPTYTQPVFARGLFVYVNNNKGQFTFNSRPLHDVLDNPFGAITATPSDTTYWNINGVTYTGSAGLTALQKLQSETDLLQIAAVGPAPGSGVATWSDLTGVTPIFTPTQVYVGTSLESTIEDQIVGWVSGISTSSGTTTLTVQNAFGVDRLGDYGFSNTTTITAGSSTIVSIDGVNTSVSLADISVGQLISVLGQVTDTTDTYNAASLDATAGQVRLQPTSIWGTLVSGTTSSATIDLQWIQGLELTSSNISFTGTGTSSAEDATAASYVVSTATTTGGATDESATAAGTLLNIVGLANVFGAGPPYFNATTVTQASTLPQRLILEYTESGSNPGSNGPFNSVAANGLVVNLADPDLVGTSHVSQVGPQSTDILAAATQNGYTTLQIIPATTGTFSIGNTANGQAMYFDPTSFATQITSLLAAGATNRYVQKIVADGQYDATAGTFTATNIEVVMQD